MKICKKTIISMIGILFIITGCEKELETIPTDRFASDNIAQSSEGIEALLFSAYKFSSRGRLYKDEVNILEVNTDIAYNSGGAENRELVQFINFTVDGSSGWLQYIWNQGYFTIRDANIVLESLEVGEFEDDFENRLSAEARFLRAFEFDKLYKLFGPVPLRTATTQENNLPKASEEEIISFIGSELTEIVPDLPSPGEEGEFGRATKGSALAVLSKFYLNTKQWQKAVEATGDLIELGYYDLYPSFREMFFVENEQNREMIVTFPNISTQDGLGNEYQNGAFPPGFRRAENIPEFEWNSNMANWATQYRLRDQFIDSYDSEDQRLLTIVQEYENLNGEFIDLRNNPDDSRSLKFFDQDQVANNGGNDWPVIRYSDILLTRAEALNELNGPTEEAVSLVNQVRERAGVDPYTLGDVGGKESFRDLILKERAWEFVSEGKRREDLIRHGKYISLAQERGVDAQDYHVLFPIPEGEINSNPAVEQNQGY